MAEPIKGVAYNFFLSLVDAADPAKFKSNPTLAAGDFQVSKDGGAFANLATLPAVLPASSVSVSVGLSATEMTADKVFIKAIDQAGAEWEDLVAFIDVPVSSSETAVDILEGDHIENSTSLIINKKGTLTPVLNKQIKGSLLVPSVTISTLEAP